MSSVQRGQESWRNAIESGNLEQLMALVQDKGLAVLQEYHDDNHSSGTAVSTPLLVAARYNHVSLVRYLLEQRGESFVDLNSQEWTDEDSRGWTALHFAVSNNSLVLVQLLVEFECNLNVTNNGDETPIYLAVEQEHWDVALYLVAQPGCDMDTVTQQQDTALHLAVQKDDDQLDIVRRLLLGIAAPEQRRTAAAQDALHYICEAEPEQLNVMKRIIDAGLVNVNAQLDDNNESTILHVACREGHGAIVQYLLSCGGDQGSANVEARDRCGRTPLLEACASADLELVQYLVETSGANVRAVDSLGNSALHHASRRRHHCNVFQYLKDQGLDVQQQNDKETVLHVACFHDNVNLVPYLIRDCSVNVNVKNASGQTALHVASRFASLDIVQCLVKDGKSPVNVSAQDNRGQTALHMALTSTCLVNAALRWDRVRYLVDTARADSKIVDELGQTAIFLAAERVHNGDDDSMRSVLFLVSRIPVEEDNCDTPERLQDLGLHDNALKRQRT